MPREFENKVVLITGASGNVGSAVARRFAGGGARLVLVGRDTDQLTSFGAELQAESLAISADLTKADEVESMVAQAEARFGHIDILAHTVGGFTFGKHVYDPGLDALEKMWNLNVVPVYLTCGRVARHMLEHQVAGHITVVLARAAQRGGARTSAYTASKAAALRLVESLALEVRDQGIHVNAVSPSIIDTPQNRADMPKADVSKWVTAEQIADTIAFLSSDAAAGLYGANLEVYGRA